MRIFYNNLGDAASLTATSAQTLLPVTNVQNEAISLPWRTGTSVAAENVVFDLGSATALTAAIIAGHTLLSTDSTITLRASTDNFASSNVLVGTFTWQAGNMLLAFGSASYRYWKVSFTKASAGVTRDIGRIFLGTYFESTEDPHYTGYDLNDNDNSVSQTSRGGQEYFDIRERFDTFTLDFKALNQTDVTALRTISNTVGKHTSVFVQTQTTSPLETAYYAKMRKPLTQEVAGFDAALTWDVKLEFKQSL